MELKELDQYLRVKTWDGIVDSRHKYKENAPLPQIGDEEDYILFMGTGGNPEATMTQIPATAGFILNLGGFKIYVDPGPGAISAALNAKVDLRTLDAVYVSHGHIDHYAGVESIIEGMCWAMSARRGYVMGPPAIFDEERAISYYHQGNTGPHGYKGGPTVIHLEEGKQLEFPELTLTPVKAYHGGQNFGFVIEHKGMRIGYTSDTNYIRAYRSSEGLIQVNRGQVMDIEEIVDYRRDIKEAFSNVDVLIANITAHNAWPHRHITSHGLVHLLKDSRVKLCLMSHFNYSCVIPEDIRKPMAQFVEQASGVKTLPAMDLAKFNLGGYYA